MPRPLVVGSRRSPLARAQTEQVISRLRNLFPGQRVVMRTITTVGDRAVRGTGLIQGIFVKELENALLEGEIDIAVHSMKDVPVQPRAGLTFAAMPVRADARDAFVSCRFQSWQRLPAGSRVGTSSARRAVQLLHHRPDVKVVALRGNVDTRLAKLSDGRYDAVLLAVAGLQRLGYQSLITQWLPFSLMLPAPGQGALGVQVRAADRRLVRRVRCLDDAATRCAVEAERAFLTALGGGCGMPAAAYGRCRNGILVLRGMLAESDGVKFCRIRLQESSRRPQVAGRKLMRELRRAQRRKS